MVEQPDTKSSLESIQDAVKAVLADCQDPYLEKDLLSADLVKRLEIQDGQLSLSVELPYPAGAWRQRLSSELQVRLQALEQVRQAEVEVSVRLRSHAVQRGVKPLPEVKNIIAIASGKGGVGKSTTAVNLALALQAQGACCGILDADIYGPSQPMMLGCSDRPETPDGQSMQPLCRYQLQSMSIGYLVDEQTPMIWRGPMATSALRQLVHDTRWQELDYLIVDLPPGTGDIQLSLSQQIPLSGAIIVTTPQDISLLDARRALQMFEKVKVPVLGLVENMSVHVCRNCGHEEHIFGAGGGERMAQQYGIPLLGSLPLDAQIREGVDNGKPTVAVQPDSAVAHSYCEIARRAAARLALQAVDYSARIPRIVIEPAAGKEAPAGPLADSAGKTAGRS